MILFLFTSRLFCIIIQYIRVVIMYCVDCTWHLYADIFACPNGVPEPNHEPHKLRTHLVTHTSQIYSAKRIQRGV